MSTYLLSYREGTLSVANGSTSVTGTLTVWTTNVQPGDLLVIGTTWAEVASIQSNTALTLVSAWSGTTATGSAYIIHRFSKGWSAAGTTALLLSLYESNRPSFIPTTGAPSNSIGADGNIAVDWTAGLMYRKEAGAWGSGLAFRTRPSGAYSGATAYAAGDIVTNQSASWIARVATTGVAPPTLPTETNTQWQLIGKSGDLTRLDAVAAGDLAAWTGVNSAQIRKATAAEVRTAAGGIRETLTAARTYYVRSDGNNANDGLTNSAGGAKLTIAGALSAAYSIDAKGQNVTINIAAGTWTENISVDSLIPGLNRLYFVGAGENSTIIGANSGTALLINVPIRYQIQNLTLGAVGGGNSVGLWGRYGSVGYLTGGNVGFNGLTARAIGIDTGANVESTSGEIRLRGNTPSVFYFVSGASATLTAGCTVKTMTPITCSGGFAALLSASATIVPTFDLTAGAVTGPRYSVSRCGALTVNGAGANFLPGSTAGTVDAVSYYG